MMQKFFLLLITCLLLSHLGMAKSLPKRSVGFEWEPSEGATGYEIELTFRPKDKEDKPQSYLFKTVDAKWNGKLSPGMYSMRLRSKDRRGVPGEWSGAEDFPVNLEKTSPVFPSQGKDVKAKSDKEETLELTWAAIPGADIYEIKIDAPGFSKSYTSESNKLSLNLPVAREFTWTVIGKSNQGLISDPMEEIARFVLWGAALEAPKVEMPLTEYVRFIEWKNVEGAAHYDVILQRYETKTLSWKTMGEMKAVKDNEVDFPKKWPGGKYRALVTANAPFRMSSVQSPVTFDVASGSRSLAAENRALVRAAIDRTKDWYFIASYLVTMIDYQSENLETGAGVATEAFGGTGRLGTGYLNSKVPWGFLGIVDLSGFIIGDRNYTYPAAEVLGLYRFDFEEWGELRLNAGLYYKEIPEILGDPQSGVFTLTQLSTFGPHVGGEYWFSLTPKLGLQFNSKYYLSTGGKTPNGLKLLPTSSLQMGVLGSYRLYKKVTGLMGYAYRKDAISYESSLHIGGKDSNQITIVGNYLNLYLEWDY